MLVFWFLVLWVRNSVVLAVYLLFLVACFFTVHEHYRRAFILKNLQNKKHSLTNDADRRILQQFKKVPTQNYYFFIIGCLLSGGSCFPSSGSYWDAHIDSRSH